MKNLSTPFLGRDSEVKTSFVINANVRGLLSGRTSCLISSEILTLLKASVLPEIMPPPLSVFASCPRFAEKSKVSGEIL